MRKSFGVIARAAPALAVFLITLTATATDEPSDTSPATRPNAAPPSIKAFSHTPGFTEVALSPDGTMLAMDEPAPPDFRVFMLRVKDGQRVRTVNVDGNNKLRRLKWADDKTVLMDVSVAMHLVRDNKAQENWEIQRTFALDLAGGKPRTLLMDGDWERSGGTGSMLHTVSIGKPGKIAMSAWDWSATRWREQTGTKMHNERRDSGWTYNLYEVDLANGRGRTLATGTPYTSDWQIGIDGSPVARSEWNGEKQQYAVLARRGNSWTTIFELDDGESPCLCGVTADGRGVVIIGENGLDRAKAWAVPFDGSPPRVLYEDPKGEVVSAIKDAETAVGLRVNEGAVEMHWLDDTWDRQWKSLGKAFPGKRIGILDRSQSGRQMLVRVGAHAEPPVVYLVDFYRGAADIVGEEYPALVGAQLGAVRSYAYPARDGTSIPAFLTLPPGIDEARNLPLVVMPHGGPESHDSTEFHWFAQFLATRGYAVLQPQFRGSTGYGKAHRQAGRRQWGLLMQDDVTDGAAYLVKTGQADPRRICIIGSSYGGYAALAGAVFTPDLYACAVSINGIGDLPKMLALSEHRFGDESDQTAYWREHIGSPNDLQVIARSPARSAANVRAPVLLLHAAQDTVVPILQSELMDRALTEAGKPHKFVRLDGEDHWLSRSATREQVLTEVEQFLAETLEPAAP